MSPYQTCQRVFLILMLFSVSVQASVSAPDSGARDIRQWYTSNGMKVLFLAEHSLPMVDFRLVFDAGSARDRMSNRRLSGLANFTNRLIFEGTSELNADQIADTFADIGVNYGNGIDRDSAKLYLRSLVQTDILNPALDTLGHILNRVDFSPRSIARERSRILVELQRDMQIPVKKASHLFYRTVYGTHPYASPLSGTSESVQNITRKQIMAFYQQYYVAKNAVLAIVGDLQEQRARALSEQLSLALPQGRKAPRLPAVTRLSGTDVIWQPHKASQATVFIGQPAISRGDPDYFPFYVGNYILGSFGARLMQEIRLKRGLTYTIESLLIPMRVMGPFLIRFSAQPDAINNIIELVFINLNRFLVHGPTPLELQQAKIFITSYFPFRLDSNLDMVENLADIGFYNLPLTYLDDYIANIQSVTQAQIIAVFRQRIERDKMHTVIVGPISK